MRKLIILSSMLVSASLAGCVGDDRQFLAASEPASRPMPPGLELDPKPIPSSLPWQLTPSSTRSAAQGEKIIEVADERFGKVKGTPIAVANLDKPLIAFERRGPVVAACKKVFEEQAKSVGAFSVQAAASGPTIRKAGARIQQVFFRIIYDKPDELEVRQAALVCTIDNADRVVEAKPI